MIIAIPIKAGFSNKIRTVVNDYNKEVADSGFGGETVIIFANRDGAGLRMTF